MTIHRRRWFWPVVILVVAVLLLAPVILLSIPGLWHVTTTTACLPPGKCTP
jgi:hypothetical protein